MSVYCDVCLTLKRLKRAGCTYAANMDGAGKTAEGTGLTVLGVQETEEFEPWDIGDEDA